MLARHSSHDPPWGPHAKIVHVPAPPSRRLALTGSLSAALLALAGCGVRLEDDAPDLPFVPRRAPIPGETALLVVLAALESQDGPLAATRADALREALREAQVPRAELQEATAPVSEAEVVAAFEGALRECGQGLLTLVGQLCAGRIRTDGSLWTTAGEGAWTRPGAAATSLEATRATAYAMDVIAARGGRDAASRARRTRTQLRRLTARQADAARDAASEVTLGYEVDAQGMTPASAVELGQRSLGRATAVYSSTLARLGADREAALETVHWMATVQGQAESWGAQPVALIGADEA